MGLQLGLDGRCGPGCKRQNANTRLYGVDMSQELANDMLDPSGKVYAIADQQPYQVGYSAIETAAKDLKGKPYPVMSKLRARSIPGTIPKRSGNTLNS